MGIDLFRLVLFKAEYNEIPPIEKLFVLILHKKIEAFVFRGMARKGKFLMIVLSYRIVAFTGLIRFHLAGQ